jgi:hypothetical protein
MFGFLPAAPELGDGESAAATDPTTPRSAATAISSHKLLSIKFRFIFWFLCVLVVWICAREGAIAATATANIPPRRVCRADFIVLIQVVRAQRRIKFVILTWFVQRKGI